MAASTDKPIGALDYLLAPAKFEPGSIVVVAGDESYLKREVLATLRGSVVGEDQGDFAWSVFEGGASEWRDVADALASVSLFGGGRQVALVEDADKFVTRFRSRLEDYADRASASNLLVLDVKTWSAATRLAKRTQKIGLTIKANAPEKGAERGQFVRTAKKWLIQRATARHNAKLEETAADLLFEVAPLSLGVMDQEVARLALLAGSGGVIDAALVRKNVGGWRTQSTWDMIDAIADGAAGNALLQLDRLLRAGEQPIGLLAQISSTLRRFTVAAGVIQQGEERGQRVPLRSALEQAGVPKFKLADSERQLRQIGRVRAAKLAEWLLECDLALKGHNSHGPRARLELERLVARLSTSAAPRRPNAAADKR